MRPVGSSSESGSETFDLNGPAASLSEAEDSDEEERQREYILRLRGNAKSVSSVSVEGTCAVIKGVAPIIAAAVERPGVAPIIVGVATAVEPVAERVSHAVVDTGSLDRPLGASSGFSGERCIIL